MAVVVVNVVVAGEEGEDHGDERSLAVVYQFEINTWRLYVS